jgi:hypothetical protein
VSQGGRFAVFAVFVNTGYGSPDSAAPLIRERLEEIDSALPAYGFCAMNEWDDTSSARTRIRTWVVDFVAAVAAALGMIGIHGVLALLTPLAGRIWCTPGADGQPGSLIGSCWGKDPG